MFSPHTETVDEAVKSMNKHLMDENQRVQQIITTIQDQHRKMTLQVGCKITRSIFVQVYGYSIYEWLIGGFINQLVY